MAEPKAPYVQPQAYYPDGTPIPKEEFGKAVSEGKARFEEGAKVYVRNQDGKLQTVDATDVYHRGVQVQTPEEVHAAWEKKEYGKGLANQAKAGAAGAARGLTLGASDYVATQIGGEETRQDLDALRRQNPISSVVGEVAGAAAPLLLSGGGSAAARGALAAGEAAETASLGARAAELAGTAVRAAGAGPRALAKAGSLVERGVARGLESLGYRGETLLGRTAAGALKGAASGAVEGAGYGAAQTVSDNILSGDEVTAEKLVASMGEGALFGGALGGALGAAVPLAGKAAEKILPSKGELETFARDRALKAVGRDTERIGKDLPAAERAALRQTVGDDLRYVIKTGDHAGQTIVSGGDNVEQILGKLTSAKRESGAALGGLKEEVNELMLAKPELAPDMGELFERIQQEVIDPLLKTKSEGSRAQARAVERELRIYRREHEARLSGVGNDNAGLSEVTAPPSFLDLDKYRQTLSERLTPKGTSRAIAAASNKNLEPLEKTAKVINEYLKGKAEAALTAAGEDANAYRELSRQYFSFTGLEKAADKSVAANARNRSVSPSDHAVGLVGFLSAIASGNVGALGAIAYGAAGTVANNLLRERGNSLLSSMARKAAEMDVTIDRAARAMAGHASGAKAAGLYAAMDGKRLKDEYDRTSERIRELARPEIALDHTARLAPEVSAHYPHVGTAVSGKLLGVYQALSAKLPPTNVSKGDTLTPLATRPRASTADMRKFMSAVQGALRPESVIDDLARGRIDRDALDMVKAIYPRTFDQLRTAAITYTAERQDELPYRRRVFMSLAFGFAGDSSLEPKRLAELQEAVSAPSASNGDSPVQPKTARPRASRLGRSFATLADSALGNT